MDNEDIKEVCKAFTTTLQIQSGLIKFLVTAFLILLAVIAASIVILLLLI